MVKIINNRILNVLASVQGKIPINSLVTETLITVNVDNINEC